MSLGSPDAEGSRPGKGESLIQSVWSGTSSVSPFWACATSVRLTRSAMRRASSPILSRSFQSECLSRTT